WASPRRSAGTFPWQQSYTNKWSDCRTMRQRHCPGPTRIWRASWWARADLRNASEAVTDAELACQLARGTNALFFGTLAAAYANASRFDDAIRTAERA